MERREESVCVEELEDRRVIKRKREEARQEGEGTGTGAGSSPDLGSGKVGALGVA